MEIRVAIAEDAADACEVVRRSIIELCDADHRNDDAILSQWLANKTAENVGRWIARPDQTMLVAVEQGRIQGVGLVTDEGEINLVYVSPAARFRGVSKLLLAALEDAARRHGNDHCRLVSSGTARQFYLGCGYQTAGAPDQKHGHAVFPMIKALGD